MLCFYVWLGSWLFSVFFSKNKPSSSSSHSFILNALSMHSVYTNQKEFFFRFRFSSVQLRELAKCQLTRFFLKHRCSFFAIYAVIPLYLKKNQVSVAYYYSVNTEHTNVSLLPVYFWMWMSKGLYFYLLFCPHPASLYNPSQKRIWCHCHTWYYAATSVQFNIFLKHNMLERLGEHFTFAIWPKELSAG